MMIRSSRLMTRTQRARYFVDDAVAAVSKRLKPRNKTQSTLSHHRW